MNLNALRKVEYGMFIVSSNYGEKKNGQIVNTMFQVTAEPCCIAVSINKKNLTHEFIEKSGKVTVSILSQETPMTFIGKFGFKSGRDTDKFKDTNAIVGVTGAPIVTDFAVGYLEGTVSQRVDAGTHTIFLVIVAGAEVLNDKVPMTYSYYHTIKGGLSPKNAPTYIKP
jgi:ferric-chelate reductase [NAD(P)H]